MNDIGRVNYFQSLVRYGVTRQLVLWTRTLESRRLNNLQDCGNPGEDSYPTLASAVGGTSSLPTLRSFSRLVFMPTHHRVTVLHPFMETNSGCGKRGVELDG